MIQRVQSVYLALAGIFMVITLFVPWTVYSVNETLFGSFDLFQLSMNGAVFTLPVFVSVIGSVILSMVSVFLFSNRIKQMQLVRMSLLFSLIAFLSFAVLHYIAISRAGESGDVSIEYSPIVVIPLIAAVLQWMAYRAIKKDENLVKSVDRLR